LINILDIKRSNSLSRYSYDKGWIPMSDRKTHNLISSMKIKHPRKKRKKLKDLYLTKQFNLEWKYTQHLNPIQVVSLYCTVPRIHSLENLPCREAGKSNLDENEVSILNSLLANQTCQVYFSINKLLYDYSVDFYEVEIPNIPLKQFSRVLDVLPYSHIFFTKSNIFLWTVLKPEDKEWINELNWNLRRILLHHAYQIPDLNWFDLEHLAWIPPRILSKCIFE
ncbi:MAG: hypothetical protein ACXACU_15805, partial [Candidatus Hodarchaeales archaeon]